MTADRFLLTDRHGGFWWRPDRCEAPLLELGPRVDYALHDEAIRARDVIRTRAVDATCRAITKRGLR